MRNGMTWAVLALFVGGSAVTPACHCAGNGTVTANGDAGPKDDHQLNCHCVVNLNGTPCPGGAHEFDVEICLPPALNNSLDPSVNSIPQPDYNNAVKAFCENSVMNDVKDIVFLLKPLACPNSFGCVKSVMCEPQALPSGLIAASNANCDVPCDTVPCVAGTVPAGGPVPGGPNCDPDKVVDGNNNVHPEFCKCTQATTTCDPPVTSEVFCQAPVAGIDPPVLKSGLLSKMVSLPTTIALDHDQSTLDVSVHFEGGLGEPHDDEETPHVNGKVRLYGRPCPGAACDMLLDMELYPDDVTFNFSAVVCGPTCIQDVHAHVEKMSIVGGMGTTRVHIAADGTGHIPMNTLTLHALGFSSGIPNQNPAGQIFDQLNSVPIDFAVDWTNRTFTLPAAPFNFEDAHGTLTLVGTLVNQPPHAQAAVATQTLECTSPDGAQVTLDGSGTTDPDDNIFAVQWWKGAPLTGGHQIGSSAVETTIAPLGSTTYYLSAADSALATSFAREDVTVSDTTAPVLSLTASPDCLWPPNHKMALFSLGDGLTATAVDACDPAPSVRIVNVVSDQGASDPSSGNTAPDVRFGSAAFCVRSERDGKVKDARHYTVTVEARDATGNTTQRDVVIEVPHDQGQGHCANVDPSRIVDDDDPRCVANVPAPPAPPAPPAAARSEDPVALAGCAAGGGASPGAAALFPLAVLGALRRRRRRNRGGAAWARGAAVASILLAGCGSATSSGQTVDQCVTGWWQNPQPGGCLCPAEPECQAGDCVAFGVRGLLADQRYFDGHVAVSQNAHTMSANGQLSAGTWSITSSTISVKQPNVADFTANVTCTGDQLTFGFEQDQRPPQNLATALDQATATGNTTWKAFPVPP
jgi:MYXO-CTERM domain-containing protein